STADVARQQGVPATTVRSRLRAALVALRDRLDAEESGDRGRWHLALTPIATVKAVPATAPLWPLVFAAAAALATTGVAIGAQRAAARGRPMPPGSPARAMRSMPSTPDPPPRGPAIPAIATTRDDEVSHNPSFTPAFSRAEKTLMKHVDECYEISHRAGRDL